MTPMLKLVSDLAPIRSGVVCDGADIVASRLQGVAPFQVHEFASGVEHNGWTVPWSWNCQKATIHQVYGEEQVPIWDGQSHPLGVCSYSEPFQGEVDGKTLKQHLYFCDTPGFEHELIYMCDWWYKPHARSWGIVVPKAIYEGIADSDMFYVDLRCTFTPGTMKVLEWVLPGDTDDTIVLNANACHPGCSNDDLSGCAVGIQVMRMLEAQAHRRYTYCLVIAPEHYGSIFYLQRFGGRHIHWALFLESLGTTGPLALQESMSGQSRMDLALRNALCTHDHYTGEFRSIVGNDETCWEAQGIAIPCPSLSRCPFPEYHTSRDNPSIMSEQHLEEAACVVFEALTNLDRDVVAHSDVEGLVCLSNPKYDLYKPFLDPSIPGRRTISDGAAKWNKFMNWLPRYFDGWTTALELAQRFGLKAQAVRDYLASWAECGLLRLKPPTGRFQDRG
jgi:aminopeptidase-like protein